ncbi:MAG: Inactivated Zn-dependent protease component of TldD/TldE system [Candidatus Methanohalarchaeum thermophilum]|uniref:Inactivated Zn-dependent protease component of TldD/TldE system n=1 Tax=Methanohalarchaeum thermophilum TaxID=1903181 RepID=A0A1Q6DT79_METT1|nr:MAG: Inactivated Zn-dependent protease component of TldD/TldE system [Candidatus Methanohalarchaeum thermophilum]
MEVDPIFEPKNILDNCLKKGADQAEVYYKKTQGMETEIEKDDIKYNKFTQNEGVGIRVIKNQKVGFSSTSNSSKVEERINDAINFTRSSNIEMKNLPEPGEYPEVKGIYDTDLTKLEPQDLIKSSKEMINASKTKNTFPASGSVSTMESETKIINSNGIDISEKETMYSANIEVISKSTKEQGSAYEFEASRQKDIDFKDIGEKAAYYAENSLGKKSMKGGEKEIILGPLAFASILKYTLVPSLSAEEVQRGRSKAQELMNKKIAPEYYEMIDDQTMEEGLNSKKSDDEGIPSRKNEIVKDGVLKNLFYDQKTALRENKKSTSNATRNGYGNLPQISPRNLKIKPVMKKEELIEEDILYIRSILGAHTANPVSGDFSVGIKNAYRLKNKEITEPISDIMISGNIFQLLKNIKGIGEKTRKVRNIITPPIKTKLNISSS